jgi:hypothetical protein
MTEGMKETFEIPSWARHMELVYDEDTHEIKELHFYATPSEPDIDFQIGDVSAETSGYKV